MSAQNGTSPRGLHMAMFAKQSAKSADGGIFSLKDIAPYAGIKDPAAMEPEDVETAVAFDLAFDSLKRELLDRIAENAQPAKHVVVLTNGAVAHPPPQSAGFFADLGTLQSRVRDYTRRIHSANFANPEGTSLALQWALVNEAFHKGVPVIYAESSMTEGDHIAVSRMRERGHGLVRSEHIPTGRD